MVLHRTGWSRRHFLILCYHSVALSGEEHWDPELYMTPQHLRRRFERLRELGATVLSLEDALRLQRAGALPPRAVVLTFDDGTADFATHVVPLLREFGYPAMVYVTTKRVLEPYPAWPGYARYAAWAATHGQSELVRPAANRPPSRWAGRKTWEQLDAEIQARWSSLPPADQDRALRLLAAFARLDDAGLRERRAFTLMTPAEIRALPPDLVSVQLHTHAHCQPEDPAAYDESIRTNSDILAGLTGIVPRHFCYPSGQVTAGFRRNLARLGIETATTCVPGAVGPATDRLTLPRLVDTGLNPEHVFDSWVTGTAAVLRRVLRRDRPLH